jgi:hypothetical protein
MRREQSLG